MADFTINIPKAIVPEGYLPLAFRPPYRGEKYLNYDGDMVEAGSDRDKPRLILQKKPPVYRDPTPDDAGRMVEVRNFLDKPWGKPQELVGILTNSEDSVFVIRHGTVGYLQQWRFARIEA